MKLTQQQDQILRALARGETTETTARRLGLTAATVKAHRHRLYFRLGARNAAHAVGIACRRQLIDPRGGEQA